MYIGLLNKIVQYNVIYWTIKIYSLKKIKILDLTIYNTKKDEVLFYKNKTSSLVAAKPLIMILVWG